MCSGKGPAPRRPRISPKGFIDPVIVPPEKPPLSEMPPCPRTGPWRSPLVGGCFPLKGPAAASPTLSRALFPGPPGAIPKEHPHASRNAIRLRDLPAMNTWSMSASMCSGTPPTVHRPCGMSTAGAASARHSTDTGQPIALRSATASRQPPEAPPPWRKTTILRSPGPRSGTPWGLNSEGGPAIGPFGHEPVPATNSRRERVN